MLFDGGGGLPSSPFARGKFEPKAEEHEDGEICMIVMLYAVLR